MLVKDIYGSRDNEYTSLGLSSTLIASSFGKAIHLDCTGADGKEVSQKFALLHEPGLLSQHFVFHYCAANQQSRHGTVPPLLGVQ